MKKTNLVLIIVAVLLTAVYFPADSKNEKDSVEIKEKEISYVDYYKFVDRKELSAPQINALTAYSVYIKDDEKEILFSKNRNKRLPIASLTKLMTSLVIYDNYNLSKSIGISGSKMVKDSHLSDLRVFSTTSFRELLYPLLIESNNSGAYAAAIAPKNITFEKFVDLMNEKARELDMQRTVYYNPSGLDNMIGINLSTARDQSKLIEELLNFPLFWDILSKKSYELTSSSGSLSYQVKTTNKFLDGSYFQGMYPDWYSEIKGGKTGFTYAAGGCLIIVLEKDGGHVVNIILGADGREERFREMEKLINWVNKAYKFN